MNRILSTGTILLLCCFLFTGFGYAHERNDGGYFTVVDESGNSVYLTGRLIEVGDEILTEHNKRYEIIGVDGDTARAKFLGNINLAQYLPRETYPIAFLPGILQPRIAEAQGGKVAIYHTHSDESYVPTDGAESKLGAGGIYKVGAKFADALKGKGLQPIFSTAKHDPHDSSAYQRSRRTVTELLKQKPDAIFDIHRDAVPPEAYKTQINGQDVTKVQLVVGKYGPTGKQIEDYALKIKAVSDSTHKGLVKGIFFAKGGDYNQDLHPRSMLLEVGAHTNDRESAERGIALFADVIPKVLGQTSTAGGGAAGTADTGLGSPGAGASGAAKSTGWILGLLIVGGAAFLILSTGSLKEAGAKLKQFTSSEFANFLGPKLKRKKSDDSEKDKDPK